MQRIVNRLYDFFRNDLWDRDTATPGRLRSFLAVSVRTAAVVIRDVLVDEKIALQARALVFSTLLALVPLLAVSFSVLKAFGVHNAVEPFLIDLLAPLGPGSSEIAHRIVGFVNNMKVGVLGFVGLGVLVYTVVSLIGDIEAAFNTIWRVRSLRRMPQQFSGYLSVVLVGPLLVVSALGMTATLMSTTIMQRLVAVGPVGVVFSVAGNIIPYILVCGAFTFIYRFLPNTRVRFGPALAGGIVGGVLWETIGWGFATFIAASPQYGAVYSGFAVLVLFMIWLYLSWIILLIGAEVSFYRQNPQFLLFGKNAFPADARVIERTALSIMYLIALHFYRSGQPWTVNALAKRLQISPERVEELVVALRRHRLITRTSDEPPAYLPERDIGTITLRDVYAAVRSTVSGSGSRRTSAIDEVEEIIRTVDGAVGNALGSRTIRDVVSADAPRSGEREHSDAGTPMA